MNRNLLFMFVCYCCTIIVCSCKSPEQDRIGRIDIAEGLNNIALMNLSEVAKSIEYIPLETTEESLIGHIVSILYDKDHIYIADRNGSIKIFDQTGKYQRSINRLGRGPEEYIMFFSVSLSGKNIAVTTMDDIVVYDVYGNFIRKVGIPKVEGYNIFTPVVSGENCFTASLINLSSDSKYCAVVYDSLLNIRKMISAPSAPGGQATDRKSVV